MKSEQNYKDELDYLSQQGYEKVKLNDADINDLKKKIRQKTISFKQVYFGLSVLLIGIVIGGLSFFVINEKEKKIVNTPKTPYAMGEPNQPKQSKVILLDTVLVKNENFINPAPVVVNAKVKSKSNETITIDSADVIVSKPIDLSLLTTKIKEEQLKFMINSPVFYLHDMKVTNYTTLYFKKNHFVSFSGTSAEYSNAMANSDRVSRLKQSADYFLHEEIAQAMLYFKKGKYDQAILSLNLVSTYNKEDLNCDFYLAMSYYYKKNYAKAIDLFNNCITHANNSFFQEASYYKAVSFYESGDLEKARLLFKKIAEENEFYSAKAKSYLLK